MKNWHDMRTAGARAVQWVGLLATAALMAACGGGNGEEAPAARQEAPATADVPATQADAARFLAQASFGANDAEIRRVMRLGYTGWLNDQTQFTTPLSHRGQLDARRAALAALVPAQSISRDTFYESFWTQAVSGDDQLRQRATFALSQIFVVSFNDPTLAGQPRGVASYYDMLAENAFGNFRDLLEDVTLHPMMGIYLSHLRNQKEDPVTGRVPDLNFAREITQLFTIGQYRLNADGTVVMNGGRPVEAYTSTDLTELSKVFTGWSWYAGPSLADRTNSRFNGGNAHPDRDWRPMQAYNNFHSTSQKQFFGVTIPAQTTPDAEGDLRIALDTLFNHPNVGPFIGKQLIQRLVTSNPSPQYVARVTAAFNDNGRGVRGDMKAVWRAVLMDAEARAVGTSPSAGKLREPVLRLAHWMRAFNARSDSRRFAGIDDTDDAVSRLSQTPMRSPSVFNFFRPGYVPSSESIAAAGMVAPEFQLANEVSVAGYANYIRGWIQVNDKRDVRQNYDAEIALASTPDRLVDRIDLLLFNGRMPAALRTQITEAVTGRTVRAATASNQADVLRDRRDRVYIAIYLAMVSPDYLIQK